MGVNVTSAAALVIAGALYIRLRWHRSPRAYRAIIALPAGYFVAGSIIVRVVLLGILGAGSVVAFGANGPSAQQTFVSSDRAFEFIYSAALVLCQRDPKYSDLWQPHDSCEAYIPVCSHSEYWERGSDVIACVAYPSAEYAGSTFEGAAFVVSVLKQKQTEPACLSNLPDGDKPTIHSEIINGVTFKVSHSGGVGMGHVQDEYLHRAFYQHKCYELDVNISEHNDTGFDPGSVPRGFGEVEFNKVHLRLEQVLGSFRFLK